jgi:alpha-1,3-rhamnosyl/mannosyltransferase
MPHYVLDGRTATPHFPGIGRYVTNLARAMTPLLAGDERLTLLYHPQHPLALPASRQVASLPVAASPFGLAQQWQIPRLLRLLRTDLYHSAYIVMPYAPGAPTVLTVYDLIPLLFPQQSSGRARLMARWANRLALRAARAVLAISDATRRDYIHHLGVRPDKIVTIPLAAEVGGQGAGDRGQGSGVRGQEAGVRGQGSGVSRNAPHALRTTHYALRNTHYVLYLGSNKPHKNLVRLIEAWRIVASSFQLPASGLDLNLNLSLVIAGSWDARYPEARHRVAELGLADRVVFLGPVAEAELPALYTGAELFVFPSLYEGFGLPVLEAMACGTPVVCSNVSSLPEVAGDAACQVNPLAVDELAAAIGRVLGDAALRQQMRERGLAQAARFSWPRTAQETLAVYRQITAGR